jgi:hypothetical protein
VLHTLTVYCGSSDRVHPEYLQAAYRMGCVIAQRGLRLAYGAGGTGLMGAVANGALQSGGKVLGVIPKLFNTPQLVHPGLTELIVVESMHQRKSMLAEIGDGYIALPGGFGTLEELFEILTWSQIGLHHKPIGLLNARGYYEPLFSLVQHARLEGMIYTEHQDLFVHADSPEVLINALEKYIPPNGLERWIQRNGEA